MLVWEILEQLLVHVLVVQLQFVHTVGPGTAGKKIWPATGKHSGAVQNTTGTPEGGFAETLTQIGYSSYGSMG